MIVESKRQRQWWISAVLNGIPDLVIAAVAVTAFDGGLVLFVAVFVGMQLVYFAIWLKNTIWIWIRYKLRDKKILVQAAVDALVQHKFPKPDEYEDSYIDYLSNVANNEAVEANTRVVAAADAGVLQYLRFTGRAQEFLRLQMAGDDAIEEYNRKLSGTETGH